MADLILDSTLFLDYVRGDSGAKKVVDQIIQGSLSCSFCPVTLVELWQADGLTRKDEIVYQALLGFLEEVSLSRESAKTAGLWLSSLPEQERPTYQPYALLAAIAKERQEAICTCHPEPFRVFYDNVVSYREPPAQ